MIAVRAPAMSICGPPLGTVAPRRPIRSMGEVDDATSPMPLCQKR